MGKRRTDRIVVPDEPIKYRADWQTHWPAHVAPLRQGKFLVQTTDTLSIHGDAPKDFIRIREYVPGTQTGNWQSWPAWIAKVGSKYYPIESVTEQLLTRVGQTMGFDVAESQLRMVGRQVRFLSRYFLQEDEQLVHGIELFQWHLDEDLVEEIANARAEQEFYTFQTVTEAVREAFPDDHESILCGFVEMLAFDAITGQNDRHPANWGVVVPVTREGRPKFSPIYDSARALLWNNAEAKLHVFARDQQSFDAYIRRSHPQIGWDDAGKIDHFDLIQNIWKQFPQFRPHLERFSDPSLADKCRKLLEEEFSAVMSELRRDLIGRCLSKRMAKFSEMLG